MGVIFREKHYNDILESSKDLFEKTRLNDKEYNVDKEYDSSTESWRIKLIKNLIKRKDLSSKSSKEIYQNNQITQATGIGNYYKYSKRKDRWVIDKKRMKNENISKRN